MFKFDYGLAQKRIKLAIAICRLLIVGIHLAIAVKALLGVAFNYLCSNRLNGRVSKVG